MFQRIKIKDNDFCEGLSFQQCTITVFPILRVVSASPSSTVPHTCSGSPHTLVCALSKTSALCIL